MKLICLAQLALMAAALCNAFPDDYDNPVYGQSDGSSYQDPPPAPLPNYPPEPSYPEPPPSGPAYPEPEAPAPSYGQSGGPNKRDTGVGFVPGILVHGAPVTDSNATIAGDSEVPSGGRPGFDHRARRDTAGEVPHSHSTSAKPAGKAIRHRRENVPTSTRAAPSAAPPSGHHHALAQMTEKPIFGSFGSGTFERFRRQAAATGRGTTAASGSSVEAENATESSADTENRTMTELPTTRRFAIFNSFQQRRVRRQAAGTGSDATVESESSTEAKNATDSSGDAEDGTTTALTTTRPFAMFNGFQQRGVRHQAAGTGSDATVESESSTEADNANESNAEATTELPTTRRFNRFNNFQQQRFRRQAAGTGSDATVESESSTEADDVNESTTEATTELPTTQRFNRFNNFQQQRFRRQVAGTGSDATVEGESSTEADNVNETTAEATTELPTTRRFNRFNNFQQQRFRRQAAGTGSDATVESESSTEADDVNESTAEATTELPTTRRFNRFNNFQQQRFRRQAAGTGSGASVASVSSTHAENATEPTTELPTTRRFNRFNNFQQQRVRRQAAGTGSGATVETESSTESENATETTAEATTESATTRRFNRFNNFQQQRFRRQAAGTGSGATVASGSSTEVEKATEGSAEAENATTTELATTRRFNRLNNFQQRRVRRQDPFGNPESSDGFEPLGVTVASFDVTSPTTEQQVFDFGAETEEERELDAEAQSTTAAAEQPPAGFPDSESEFP